MRDISQAAGLMGLSIEMIIARTDQEIPPAFAAARNDAEAVVVMDDPLFSTYRSTLVGVAARHALPTVYYSRQFVEAGGLMSYGSRPKDIYRQAGVYVGRILNGASPADLPVLQPTAFELTINVKVAWALNLQIPPTLLARADEVIE